MKKYRITTHLFLNDKKITNLDDLRSKLSPHIEVIFINNNLLKTVGQFENMENLTHLYLQWNRINSLENLNDLPNLSHLYLGFNCIKIISGLQNMPNLKILHVEKQTLPSENLKFEQNTITSLSLCLLELNISGNNLTSLSDILILNNLISLNASSNLLNNRQEIISILQDWKRLKILKIEGNPILKHFRNSCILLSLSSSLEILNDKILSTSTRPFLIKLMNMKETKEKLKTKEKRIEFSSETQSYIQQLPRDLQEIVSQSIKLNKRK